MTVAAAVAIQSVARHSSGRKILESKHHFLVWRRRRGAPVRTELRLPVQVVRPMAASPAQSAIQASFLIAATGAQCAHRHLLTDMGGQKLVENTALTSTGSRRITVCTRRNKLVPAQILHAGRCMTTSATARATFTFAIGTRP